MFDVCENKGCFFFKIISRPYTTYMFGANSYKIGSAVWALEGIQTFFKTNY